MKLENLSALFENGAYTLVLQKDGETIYKDFGRGVGPALRVYDTQPELLRGAEVCDTIVGKAAAAIYILAGASGVYAETMSAAAVDFLTANGVACACHTKTEKLLNRQGTGLCPFEQAVLELQKPEDCLPVIRQTLARLMAGKNKTQPAARFPVCIHRRTYFMNTGGRNMKKLLVLVLSLALLLTLAACTPDFWRESTSAKPVIYLYPEEKQDETCDAKPVAYLYPQTETEITVRLDYDGELTCTYPAYTDGWTVSARPDGTLTDEDGQTYRYLYWEGVTDQVYDFSSGFCVAGSDTAAFLEDALEQLGLSRAEANEFIIYWLPRMQENAYNLIAFQHEAYTESARLTITPEPDTLIRVFMAYRPLEKAVEIAPQTLTAPERTGFTAVEWGGAECK